VTSTFDRLLAAGLPFVPKPVVRRFSRPYIAGETEEEMLGVVRRLEREGYRTTVDVLGESSTTREQADSAVEKYLEVMGHLASQGLGKNVSVKLTQLGLKLDRDFCEANVTRVLELAVQREGFVRIDMEDSSTTDDTLRVYSSLQARFGNRVGPVIQAYLRRSLDDVRMLGRLRANVRLCKGIYVEPATLAYRDREVVSRNYLRLLEELLGEGCTVGIATHDERLVVAAMRLVGRLGLDATRYEFQMLLGVDETLRKIVRAEGHELRVYVPFGRLWYQYSLRRLRENPQIAGYVFKSLFA
jgi:proline dehydrogenase